MPSARASIRGEALNARLAVKGNLSAAVPNYRLARCHADCAHLFTEVKRIGLSEVPSALHCIQWDTRERRIVSVEAAMAGR
jgi:hypothetical protein